MTRSVSLLLSRRLPRCLASAASVLALLGLAADSDAQYPPQPGYPQPGYPQPGYPQPGYPQPGYPQPGYPGYPQPGYQPPPAGRPVSTGLEMAFLYGTSIAWGVGTGIWIDIEADVEDPGIAFIAPVVFGAAAPATVFLIDRFAFSRGMPEGLPSAIATGMLVGAGEGLGIAGTQWVIADEEDEWGLKGLARAEFIASTVGAGAGAGLYYWLKPKPQNNLLISSSVVWGAALGSFFGGGAVPSAPAPDWPAWGESNDYVSAGGLIGFNVALAAAVVGSYWWTPSWYQLGWMWGGIAIGSAAGAISYLFYIGSDKDPRRGLIVQGITGTIGLGVAAILARPRSSSGYAERSNERDRSFIRIEGASLMPVEKGMGAMLTGSLF